MLIWLSVLVTLQGLTGPVYVKPENVTVVYKPAPGTCDKGANAVVETSGGKAYCVAETPEQIAEKLRGG